MDTNNGEVAGGRSAGAYISSVWRGVLCEILAGFKPFQALGLQRGAGGYHPLDATAAKADGRRINMPTYIEKEALLKSLGDEPLNWTDSEAEIQEKADYRRFRDMINDASTIEMKRGHWFFVEYNYFSCSVCGKSYYNGLESSRQAMDCLAQGCAYTYCPNCGAKMTGGKWDG